MIESLLAYGLAGFGAFTALAAVWLLITGQV